MERVGNLLGQLSNLQPRAGARTKADATSIQGTVGATEVGTKHVATRSNQQSQESRSSTDLHPDEAEHRAHHYQLRRRRAGVGTDLTRIKGILSKALAHKGLDKKIERYEFILHWEEIVGESLARISKPECILNRSLIVKVVHSTWAQELAFMKPVLIQKVLPYLKKGDTIDDIVFRIGSVS